MLSVITTTYNTPPHKQCCVCKETKPAEQFHKNRALKDGLNGSCKICIAERSKRNYRKHQERRLADKAKYRQRNRELLAEKERQYRASHKEVRKQWEQRNLDILRMNASRRRARRRGQGVYEVTQKELKTLLSKPCLYCGAPSEHIDHIIPISRGGQHRIGNLAPACANCNLRKNKKLVIEWRRAWATISASAPAPTTTLPKR
jgi:5-methylcytosine-specific restriction endonuclease McrA